MTNNLKNSIDYKNYSILKLRLEYSKNGVARLKTISGATLAKAGGGGYDKKGACFKILFDKLGFDVKKYCYTKFDLFDYTLEAANDFLRKIHVNYKVNYKTNVDDNLDFIELSKID